MTSQRKNLQSIEERCFQAVLIGLEIRYDLTIPGFGLKAIPNSMLDVKKMVTTTLEKSLHKADVRYFRIRFFIATLQNNPNLQISVEPTLPKTSKFGYD